MQKAISEVPLPSFQNESKCETFHMKLNLPHKSIQMQIKLIFFMKGFRPI